MYIYIYIYIERERERDIIYDSMEGIDRSDILRTVLSYGVIVSLLSSYC